MIKLKLFGWPLNILNYEDILEYILKNKGRNGPARQIISLNPENVMVLFKNKQFEKAVLTSYGQIADGVGVVIATQILKGVGLPRLTGVDLMDRLLREASKYSLRCILIGGRGQLAEGVAECYRKAFPELEIRGTEGFLDFNKQNEAEKKHIKQIVASTRPHLVFVSFGSPQQELWIEENKELLKGSIAIGVGGAFGMLGGGIPRAPHWIRRFGLEWFFRLAKEPWRLKRQLALGRFGALVIKERFKGK